MDNFDLKKYLAEGKLNEGVNSNQGSVIISLIEKLDRYVMWTKESRELVYQAKEKEIENLKNAFNYGQTNPEMEADEYLNFINFK
jgi:hypothetical protein